MSDEFPNAETVVLFGIDPGSSKPWVGYTGYFDPQAHTVICCSKQVWNIAALDNLIREIACDSCKPTAVVVSLDAPINRPTVFNPPGIVAEKTTAAYPFNVNPFSTRPCDKALTSKPTLRLQSMRHQGIVQVLAALCGWRGDYRCAENRSFTALHPGVNVRGYMGAPHGPVVDLFRGRLADSLRACGSCLSISPREAMTPRHRHVYLLESHPAVAMAVLASSGRLGEIRQIREYKGADAPQLDIKAHFSLLRDEIVRYATAMLGQHDLSPNDDDDLDALVGFLNVVELLKGEGDWFGCVDYGYFLIPKVFEFNIWERWEAALGAFDDAAG